MPAFKDHFSRQSAAYSRHRPGYPPELGRVCRRECARPGVSRSTARRARPGRAWQLAGHFERVIAIDGSVPQLMPAPCLHVGVHYVAGDCRVDCRSRRAAALVTAAQAAHWFDFERFYAECRRVLRPGGSSPPGPTRSSASTLRSTRSSMISMRCGRRFWPPERRYVELGYRTLPFPFDEERRPALTLVTEWALDRSLGYFGSWSAVQRCRDSTGTDPLPALRRALEPHWAGRLRRLEWPLHLRVGRV